MKTRLSALLLGLGFAAMLLAAPGPVRAALGEFEDSVAWMEQPLMLPDSPPWRTTAIRFGNSSPQR